MKKKPNIKNIVLITILIILLPIILVSIIITIKSIVNKDEVPSFLGYKPFIVLSGSMETEINTGDIAVVKNTTQNEIKEGDIIAFRSEEIVITHRIIGIEYKDGKIQYITKGDNNNAEDKNRVEFEQIEGKYVFKIANLGNIAIFIQRPLGIAACLSIPFILIILVYMDEYEEVKDKVREKEKELNDLIEEMNRMRRENEELAKKN